MASMEVERRPRQPSATSSIKVNKKRKSYDVWDHFEVEYDDDGQRFDQDLTREAFARMIIVDELPFNFGDGEGFRDFMGIAQPLFTIMPSTTVAKDCFYLYMAEKRKLKNSLMSTNQRLCLTTDLWTSTQDLSYVRVTAHYIDKDWVLNKKILSFSVIDSYHKEVSIAGQVKACLKEWGVNSVFTLTVDNASSNDTIVGHLKRTLEKGTMVLDGECFHVSCCAHILNLIVRDGLKEVEGSICNIRNSIRYIMSSPERTSTFKKCCEEEGITSKCTLVLDVPTMWNYTYLMLSVALKFERAFLLMGTREGMDRDLGRDTPSDGDWENAKVVVKFLKFFYGVTKRISGSLHVTSNLYLQEAYEIEQSLMEWRTSADLSVSVMATKMKESFDKYWGDYDRSNLLLMVAIVLDPRLKLECLKFLYSEIYPSAKVQALLSRVNDLLKRLYAFYLDCTIVHPSTSKEVSKIEECKPGSIAFIIKRQQERYWKHLKHLKEQENGPKTELEKYLGEYREMGPFEEFNILGWWRQNEYRYKVLSQMARDVLAIPISTISSEAAFSIEGRVLDTFRSQLGPKLVEALICAQDWLRSQPKPNDIEARLQEIEELESVVADDHGSVQMDVEEDIMRSPSS